MDIQSAFADGPFGSGAKSEPEKPEPVATEAKEPEQRDAAEPVQAEAVKADSKDAGARDERSDEDGEAPIEGPPGSEGLQKALKSERSLRREQRKALSDALKRSEQFEAQLRQQAAQMAALQQQMQAAAQPQVPQKKDEPPGFLDDPEAYTKRVAEEHARQALQAVVPQLDQMRRQYIDQAESLYVQAKPEARAAIDRFAEIARADRRVMEEYLAVRDGRHPLAGQSPIYANPVLFADAMGQSALDADEITQAGGFGEWKKAQQAKWEAEQASKQATEQRAAVSERRAPLTLAGRRGGGSSVTPAASGPVSVEQAFRF